MTQNITISYNKKLLESSIKDIIVQVSDKFKNKDINLILIGKILQNKENQALINILNITYRDMLENYYLKSDGKLFENEKIDESYERHVDNLINKYGYNYAMKFKQNAENFVDFYLTSKQRNHKNKTEGDTPTSAENRTYDIFGDNKEISEENEYENIEKRNCILNTDSQILIKNLKQSFDSIYEKGGEINRTDSANNIFTEKIFFKIIQGNSTAEKSKSTQTSSSSNSSEKGEEEEKELKQNKDSKFFLNKKRKGPFNVFVPKNSS